MRQHATAASRRLSQGIDVVSPAPRDMWRSVVSADPDALLSHTPDWIDMICAVERWTEASRLYVWPSGRRLVLPMVAKRTFGLTVAEMSLPFGWGAGGLVGGGITPEEVAIVRADLATSKPLRRRVVPNPLQGGAWTQALRQQGLKTTVITHRAHVVDLHGGMGAAWKQFSGNARRCVRKAEKQGLEVECDTTGRLLRVFNELWLLSAQRWAKQLRHPTWIIRSHGRRQNPDERWKQIAERAAGAATFWVARYRGQPVAAIVVMRGPNDHYMRGAMDKELAGPTCANFLLHWLAIQDACGRGVHWYHMGEGVPGSQLSRFKENFGAHIYDFPELRWELFPATRLDWAARRAAKRLVGSRTARFDDISKPVVVGSR